MAEVVYENVTRRFPGNDRPAVSSLDLTIADGEFLVLVGPSGCGKSTSLRMLAGLEEVDEGRVLIGGRDVTYLPSKQRDIAMVFQNYALYPHMTAAENMGFSLRMAKIPKEDRQRRILEAARLLDLEPLLERKPRALSGGERQRVAMGRAIVREPQVFLMDEPLSNLDAKLRVQTRTQIAALQRRLEVTTVYVTHDQVEALTMGHRVAVMRDGELQQCDTPHALYESPVNVFVAGFIGSPPMNIEEYKVVDGHARVGRIDVPLTRTTLSALAEDGSDRVVLGFRPESLDVVGDGDGFPVRVHVVEEIGSDAFAYGTLEENGDDLHGTEIITRVSADQAPAGGERIHVRVREGGQHVFSALTGKRLPS
jgi:multiple sugar transport system ATP-binding protein